jgi:hypothetical protein
VKASERGGFGPPTNFCKLISASSAWRYELVAGVIVGRAAPSPDHGAIAANVAAWIRPRLQCGGCRTEVGSGTAPKREQRNTARIPDVTIRCGEHPRVIFEIISPSELRHWRDRDRKLADLQDVQSVADVFPTERGDMGQQIVGNYHSLRAQLPDGTVEIDRIPVNNRGGDEAQARRAETLVFEGAVSNFSLAMEEHCATQPVTGLTFVETGMATLAQRRFG